jgi:hypothetical protein
MVALVLISQSFAFAVKADDAPLLYSEDFESSALNSKWDITVGGVLGSASSNPYSPTSASEFGVVSVAAKDGQTNAFAFASGAAGPKPRSLQKRFGPYKNDFIELDFDWNIGGMTQRSAWISIKDSEFEKDASNKKGFRYLSLKVSFVDAENRRISYGSGDRDAPESGDGNTYNIPPDSPVILANAAPYTWYNVKVKLDFTTNKTAFSLTDIATNTIVIEAEIDFPQDLIAANNLDFGALSFVTNGAAGNGGNNDAAPADYQFRQYVDNFKIYGYDLSTPVSYNVTVNGGTGSGSYNRQAEVSVSAEQPDSGKLFRGWTKSPASLAMTQSETDPLAWTFIMPAGNVTLTPIYKDAFGVTVTNGSGGGSFAEGDVVSVTADPPEEGYIVKGWVVTPGDLKLAKDKTNPLVWTFVMPASNVSLTPEYKLEHEPILPTDISMVDEYYFKSDFFSEIPTGNAPTAEFIVSGTTLPITWASDNPQVASVDGNGLVTAVNPGVATISATVNEKTYLCKVYTPIVSESFESQQSNLWGFSTPSTATNDHSAGANYTAIPVFRVVDMDGADGSSTKAFEFATWRQDLARTGQKNFDLTQDPDIVKLKFDWNIGVMAQRSTWISIKDTKFENATTTKGNRYFLLQASFTNAAESSVSYGSGGVDCTNDGTDRFQIPSNMSDLFGRADIPVNTWISVDATLDFGKKTTVLVVTRRDTDVSETVVIPFPNDVNGEFGAFTFMSAGAGNKGNPGPGEDFSVDPAVKGYIDNFNIYGEDYPSYDLTVTDGSGSGKYKAGKTVSVTGNAQPGMSVRSWTSIPEGIELTQDEDYPNTWTFVMPAQDVTLSPTFGLAYEIIIGAESAGGAGKVRELTLVGVLKNKLLAIELTDNGKASAVLLPAEKIITLSYQKTGTKISARLVDSGESGATVFASAEVN